MKYYFPTLIGGGGISFIILVFTIKISDLHEIQPMNDTELQQQIIALDNYITSQMIIKQPNQTYPPPSDVPDMSIFTQLYETATDYVKSKALCAGCKIGIGYLMYKIRVGGSNTTDIETMVTFACKLFRIATPEVCSGIAERFAPTFTYLFETRPNLTSDTFCGVFLQSYGCTTDAPWLEWTVDIPPRPRSYFYEPQEYKIPIQKSESKLRSNRIDNSGRIKIIQISDLHIDPEYEPGANAECDNNILCCEGSQGYPMDKSLQAGQFGDTRKCDVPYSTLELTLKHIKEEHPDAKLFYMTGDIVPHNVWKTTRANNTKTIQTTAKYILEYFPDITLIPVLGNHEPHPVNFYSPSAGIPDELSTHWIYQTTYESYRQWIPEEQSESYLSYGYYSVNVSDKFRILALNTNFCYEFNVWQMYEVGDTGGQLQWLVNQLQDAESKKQTVHIVGHVPPGHDECFRVFSKNFYEIVLRYHRIIKGQFYGHTHVDELKVYYNHRNNRPINNLWIIPSLTPYEINNVAYRIYYADPVTYEIMDHETWTFDLKTANRNGGNTVEWFRSYSGSDGYGLPDVKPSSMGQLVNMMAKNYTLFQSFYKHYNKQLEEDVALSCTNHCRKRLLCGIVRSYYGEEENCNRVQMEVDGIVLPISVLREPEDLIDGEI